MGPGSKTAQETPEVMSARLHRKTRGPVRKTANVTNCILQPILYFKDSQQLQPFYCICIVLMLVIVPQRITMTFQFINMTENTMREQVTKVTKEYKCDDMILKCGRRGNRAYSLGFTQGNHGQLWTSWQ